MATKPPVDPAIYARVFEELRDGQDILEELVRRFARPAKLEGGIDAVLATSPRDGARSVVEFIVNRINAARGVDRQRTSLNSRHQSPSRMPSSACTKQSTSCITHAHIW